MKWTDCPSIEVVPGRMSGAPVLRHSRVRPEDILANKDEGAEWLAEAHGWHLKTSWLSWPSTNGMDKSLRLLFDQNVPGPLSKLLPEHEVFTADRMGWGELSNGMLLTAAQSAGFAAMVTVDKNIRYQQNLTMRQIGILVLPTQKMAILRTGLVELKAAI